MKTTYGIKTQVEAIVGHPKKWRKPHGQALVGHSNGFWFIDSGKLCPPDKLEKLSTSLHSNFMDTALLLVMDINKRDEKLMFVLDVVIIYCP